jgi:hypothetical protein
MTCSVILWAIFQGYFIPGYGYQAYTDLTGLFVAFVLIFLIAVSSGMVLGEPGMAVLSFFGSVFVNAVVEYTVLALPSSLGSAGSSQLGSLGLPPLPDLAIPLVFYSLFPVTMLLGFAGALVGSFLGERFLG